MNFWPAKPSKMKVFIYINGTIVVRNRKIVWKHSLYCWYFHLNLTYLGWPYKEHIKTAKNGRFCEKLLNENDFEAVLANFCCYDFGANTSEAVQKISTRALELHIRQLTKTANFIATPMKKHIEQFITCLLEIQAGFFFPDINKNE